MTTTLTRNATHTSTLTKVVYVTRKVQADLFAIVDTYGQISEQYAAKLIQDLRLFLDEEVIDRIDFFWVRHATNQVVGAYSYRVIANGIGLVDDRSGGIGYDRTLGQSQFQVRVYYNARWNQLGDGGREAIRRLLVLSWGPGGQLDYSLGSWGSDRTYSKNNYGLGRYRFNRW